MEKDSFNVGAIDKLLKRLIAIWFCVLMFSSVAGVSTVKICAIIGQAAKLFNIDNDYAEPSLYKTEILIASWEGTTYTDAHMDPHYSGKIFMDKKRNIWIFDVERKDGGKYYLKFGLQRVKLEILLIVMEELTEEQPQECLNNHPDFTKEGNLTGEQIGQIRKLLDDNTKHIKEHLDSWNQLFLGLLIATCIIGMIKEFCILLTKRNQIGEGLINMKDWIQKKFCSQHMSENASQNKETVIGIEEPELSKEDQVHKWLNDHPDFMDKYLGKLTEDQICKQIQKWEDAYPGLFENKYHDEHENDQVVTPTLDELSVTLTQHSGTGIEGNPNQLVSTQEMFDASQHSGEDVNNYQAVVPTPVEPPVTLTETGNEIKENQMQMSARKTFIESRSSDELVNYDTATEPTLIDLAVSWRGPVTGTEDNQGQLELSSTCNGPSSGTFSELGHSGIPPFNHNKQDANPEQDMAPDVRVVIEDSDSEDKCQEPLLKDHAKM